MSEPTASEHHWAASPFSLSPRRREARWGVAWRVRNERGGEPG